MKRTFYFLRDSVTGKFYDGKNSDGIVDFDKAAVYFQRKNAENKLRKNLPNWGIEIVTVQVEA